MSNKRLRAVGPGEKPPAKQDVPTSISEAVAEGSSRDVLAAMRRQLAKKLDAGDIASNAISSSFKELRELDRLIRLIDAEREAEEAKLNADNARGARRSFDQAAI